MRIVSQYYLAYCEVVRPRVIDRRSVRSPGVQHQFMCVQKAHQQLTCGFVTTEGTGKPSALKKITSEYLAGSSQYSNPIHENVNEVKLLLVMAIE